MITVNHLSLTLNKAILLNDICCEFDSAKVNFILGPNGASKSTLLKALAGRTPIQQGTIDYDGKSIQTMSAVELAQHRAVVSQSEDRTLLKGLTLFEYLSIRTASNSKNTASKSHLAQALSCCQIDWDLNQLVETLSGGEFQKLRIARALFQLFNQKNVSKTYLFLDEPTAALDPDQSQAIFNLCSVLAHTHGIGVICVSHDIQAAQLYADKVLFLKKGQALICGSAQEVLISEHLNHLYGVEFFALKSQSGRSIWLPINI